MPILRASAACARMQVGYCQGMAFIAGIMLMSVPEEPAFRLLARLMGEEGVGMRHLFLPGLAGLKQTLRMFEWLLARVSPGLKMHLEVSLICFLQARHPPCLHVLLSKQRWVHDKLGIAVQLDSLPRRSVVSNRMVRCRTGGLGSGGSVSRQVQRLHRASCNCWCRLSIFQ